MAHAQSMVTSVPVGVFRVPLSFGEAGFAFFHSQAFLVVCHLFMSLTGVFVCVIPKGCGLQAGMMVIIWIFSSHILPQCCSEQIGI